MSRPHSRLRVWSGVELHFEWFAAAPVLDGHRDTLLTVPEHDDGLMLVCVSRALPR